MERRPWVIRGAGLYLLCTVQRRFDASHHHGISSGNVLQSPPYPAFLAVFMLVSVYLARRSPAALGKWAMVILILGIVLFIIPVGLSIRQMDFRRITPAFTHTAEEIGMGTLRILSAPLLECVIPLFLFDRVQRNGERQGKPVFSGESAFPAAFCCVPFSATC